MKVLHIGIPAACLVALAGCNTLASDGKPVDYGTGAARVSTLDLPPDLTRPVIDERYKMPQANTGNVTTFSEYNKDVAGAKIDDGGDILPDFPNVHLERNAAQRWLVINDRAENVWPIVESFWQENGLKIKTEDRAAGIMVTDWAENLAKFRKLSSQNDSEDTILFGTYPVGERDQYTTRLERSNNGASTEVYITQRGMEEIFSRDRKVARWEASGSDPEKEAIMLQRLMVRFGSSKARAADELAGNKPAPAAIPATAISAASGVPAITAPPELPGTAVLREISNGSTIIVMNDTFDRAWRKVGLSIDSAGLGVEDKDRERGVYYLRPIKIETGWADKLMFWKSNEDTTRHYRVYVKDNGTSCEVSVTDQNGASNKASKEMIEGIFKTINKQ
ncbi:MAG: outer membrane protein assembly factor BamC [Gallionella sp.]